MVRIENWSVVRVADDEYVPPEHMRTCLEGEVFGHPRKEDGKRVITSSIKQVSGRLVTTNSGTVYELGSPAQHYEKWCEEQGWPIDTINPIKVKA